MQFVKPALIVVHRWLGVVGCLLFTLWFPSGFVMMYWGYPSVGPADRLAHRPPLDPATIRFSALEAAAKAGMESPGSVRLTTFDGRPVYRFGGRGGAVVVYADTGDEQGEISQSEIARIAASWSGQPVRAARVDAVEDADQWTLQTRLPERRTRRTGTGTRSSAPAATKVNAVGARTGDLSWQITRACPPRRSRRAAPRQDFTSVNAQAPAAYRRSG